MLTVPKGVGAVALSVWDVWGLVNWFGLETCSTSILVQAEPKAQRRKAGSRQHRSMTNGAMTGGARGDRADEESESDKRESQGLGRYCLGAGGHESQV